MKRHQEIRNAVERESGYERNRKRLMEAIQYACTHKMSLKRAQKIIDKKKGKESPRETNKDVCPVSEETSTVLPGACPGPERDSGEPVQ